MTFISLKKSLIAALAACTLTASAAAAPSPEAQLDTIASAQEVWKYEFAALCAPDELPFHLRAFDPAETRVAVADLDGNGRLELLFRHAAVPEGSEGTIPYSLRQLPTAVDIAIYEVDADGRFARLPAPEDGYGAPDLMGLDARHPTLEDGVLWYPVRSHQIYRDDHGHFYYTTAYQRVAVTDGRVKLDVRADESGYYNVYGLDKVEKVETSANIYDGNPAHEEMTPADFRQTAFYQDFARMYSMQSAVYWMTGDTFLSDPHEALAASWYTFVYHRV